MEKKDFAFASGKYPGPTNLIDKGTWRSIVTLPDDVSIRTSDKYGSQLEKLWDYWGLWTRIVGGVQALTHKPETLPTAIAVLDLTDEFQAATYAALVGYYRVAFSCLRNVLEQITIATQLVFGNNAQDFKDWRNGEERIRFGWAADMLPKSNPVVLLERHLGAATGDSLFNQAPKGLARRLFVRFSKYTHGAGGFTDGHARQSNGPIFVPEVFLKWCVDCLKTYAIALHELKLVHPKLGDLPWGPPKVSIDDFRLQVIADIPANDNECALFGQWQHSDRTVFLA